MASNIEIKAVLTDRATAEGTAIRLSNSGPEIIHQEDFFFHCPGARLKLRIFSPNPSPDPGSPDYGELIHYQRSNDAEARRSDYLIACTQDPKSLLEILSATLGILGTVTKRRTLYLIGQTRVHLDEVEGLGSFLELEVMLRPGQSDEEGKNVAWALLREFGVDQTQIIGEAYIDLLARHTSPTVARL